MNYSLCCLSLFGASIGDVYGTPSQSFDIMECDHTDNRNWCWIRGVIVVTVDTTYPLSPLQTQFRVNTLHFYILG